MAKIKHSPLPWRISEFKGGPENDRVIIVYGDKYQKNPIVADIVNSYNPTLTHANASLAVRAVNEYSKLLKALNTVESWLVCAAISSPQDMAQSFPKMLNIVSQALIPEKE